LFSLILHAGLRHQGSVLNTSHTDGRHGLRHSTTPQTTTSIIIICWHASIADNLQVQWNVNHLSEEVNRAHLNWLPYISLPSARFISLPCKLSLKSLPNGFFNDITLEFNIAIILFLSSLYTKEVQWKTITFVFIFIDRNKSRI